MPNVIRPIGTLKIFSGNANIPLAKEVCGIMKVGLGKTSVRRFADGETNAHVLENVRGCDCYLIQSSSPPVNENLMELLVMVDALRRASAGRITAVMPYYGYGRADRKVAPRVPISAKLAANLITVSGVHRVITIDLHAGQIQGFFDIPLDHLYAFTVFRNFFKNANYENKVVVSPDVGSVERARSFAKRLDMGLVIIDKRRPRPNEAMVYNIIGDVKGKTCFIFDDLVDTAGTLCMVAQSIKEQGAAKIIAAATHGVLSRDAIERIDKSPIEEMILSDTIPVNASKSAKIKVVSVAPLLAEAIKRNHMGESISELFK